MKKFLIALIVVAASVVPASAQFHFGLKAGVAINKLSLNKEALHSDNRAGFTGGVMVEFTAPIINIGMDASVLYANRAATLPAVDSNGNAIVGTDGETVYDKSNRSYIDIPINFKWKIGLPVVGKIVSPFLTTGPDFSFLLSKQNIDNAWSSRKFDFAWNVGLGVELLGHAQIAASYGIGITKSVSGDAAMNSGRNRAWTVTLAYLF